MNIFFTPINYRTLVDYENLFRKMAGGGKKIYSFFFNLSTVESLGKLVGCQDLIKKLLCSISKNILRGGN